MNKPLIILAGGVSSRMKQSESAKITDKQRSEADTRSKGLLNINGRPFLDYLLIHAEQAGFEDVIFLISHFSNEIETVYGKRFKSLRVHYAMQDLLIGMTKPAGTADALLQVMNQFPNLQYADFLVCNSDNLYSVNALRQLRETNYSNACIAYDRDALNFEAERISKFAILDIEAETLRQIIEKPSVNDIDRFRLPDSSVRVSMNIFKFSGANIYPYLRDCPFSERNEKELPTAIQMMIRQSSHKMHTILLSEPVTDLTQKDDISRVENELKTLPDSE
ncbi:MAG: NTP transferase domain-containing protein [Calditrichaeota bacterium]|nr:NTP transferase domain-containing protein [Calditrichota bacterium]